MIDINFYNFKAIRASMTPVLQLRRFRENRSPNPLWSNIRFTLFIVGAVLFGSCRLCHAYTEEEAIKTIVGEASNQGFKGMVCVGEVIRHNSSLRGFYGLNSPHSAHEPIWVWTMARLAWNRSKHTNFTRSANHFENLHDFGVPAWAKTCQITLTYKDHVFYRG